MNEAAGVNINHGDCDSESWATNGLFLLFLLTRSWDSLGYFLLVDFGVIQSSDWGPPLEIAVCHFKE